MKAISLKWLGYKPYWCKLKSEREMRNWMHKIQINPSGKAEYECVKLTVLLKFKWCRKGKWGKLMEKVLEKIKK